MSCAVFMLLLAGTAAHALEPACDNVDATASADDTQSELRLNPEIESTAVTEADIDYALYPFLKLDHNHISLNGDDWQALGSKYRSALAGDSLFSVVYLGDSHIQADFGGAVLRRRLAGSSSAGRGIAIPFKLAGTNQPHDYSVGMSSEYAASTLMRTPWSTEMPFTGVGLQPLTRSHTLRVSSATPTTRLRLHTRGTTPLASAVKADGETIAFKATTGNDGLALISLPRAASEIELALESDNSTVYGGIELLSDTVGVLTHSIGNNGATFSAYSMIDRFGSELSRLNPDLVVIALGTNEAFGRISPETLTNNVDNLIESIKAHSPGSKILLIGPTECYRRTYRRTRKGRRRTSSQTVNTKTATIARTVRLHAEELGVPYYNHYAIAGSAAKMKTAKVLGRDGVHFTATGYRLWGNLLADAILEKLTQ